MMRMTKTGKAVGVGTPTAKEWIEILSQLPQDARPSITQHKATDQRDDNHWTIEWTERIG